MSQLRKRLVLARARHEHAVTSLRELATKSEALEMLDVYGPEAIKNHLLPYCAKEQDVEGFTKENPHLSLAIVRREVHVKPSSTATPSPLVRLLKRRTS